MESKREKREGEDDIDVGFIQFGKVRQDVGECRGSIEMFIDVGKVNNKEMDAIEAMLRQESKPVVFIRGWKPKEAIHLCQIQDFMGEHHVWEIFGTRTTGLCMKL